MPPIASNIRIKSGENARSRGSLIARVGRARWLDQQDMDFATRHWPVLDAGGYNKDLARIKLTRWFARRFPYKY
jgi:hypothetical protein